MSRCYYRYLIMMALSCLVAVSGSALGGGFDYPPIPASDSHSLDLVINPQGNPVVAWANVDDGTTSSPTLLVRQWDGNRWRMMGEVGLGGPVIKKEGRFFQKTYIMYENANPSLALNLQGNPILSWIHYESLKLHFWNGTQWNEMTGGDIPGGGLRKGIRQSCLAVDSKGHIYWAWSGYQLSLCYWNGKSWAELGESAHDGGLGDSDLITKPKIALDSQDRPFVVWTDGFNMFLRYWKRGQWEGLGGAKLDRGFLGISGLIAYPALALDSLGHPTVAACVNPLTKEGMQSRRIFLKHWDGKQWMELGGSASGSGVPAIENYVDELGMVLDAKMRPVVSSTNQKKSRIYLSRWDGVKWMELHPLGLSAPDPYSFSCHVMRTDKDGNLFIAWIDRSNEEENVKIRVKKIILQE